MYESKTPFPSPNAPPNPGGPAPARAAAPSAAAGIGTFPHPRVRRNRGGRPRTGRPPAYPRIAPAPPRTPLACVVLPPEEPARDARFRELDELIAADERERRARAARLGYDPPDDDDDGGGA